MHGNSNIKLRFERLTTHYFVCGMIIINNKGYVTSLTESQVSKQFTGPELPVYVFPLRRRVLCNLGQRPVDWTNLHQLRWRDLHQLRWRDLEQLRWRDLEQLRWRDLAQMRWRSWWGAALQSGRSRVRFPIESSGFFIQLILSAVLWLWGRLSF